MKTKYKPSSRIKKRNDFKKNVGRFLKIGVVFGLILGPVFILRADFLQIKNIEVLGSNSISVESIKNTASSFLAGSRLLFLPKSSILLLDEDKLANLLLKEFPKIEKIEINKKVNKNLEISIKEREEDFFWCSLEEVCYNMDQNGLVFEKTEDRGGRITFGGRLEGDPIMQSFANREEMQNYLEAVGILKEAKIETTSINIESLEKIVFNTNLGQIIFNPSEALALPAQNAIALIEEIKSKNPSAYFLYIDARFGNKVFYKLE